MLQDNVFEYFYQYIYINIHILNRFFGQNCLIKICIINNFYFKHLYYLEFVMYRFIKDTLYLKTINNKKFLQL